MNSRSWRSTLSESSIMSRCVYERASEWDQHWNQWAQWLAPSGLAPPSAEQLSTVLLPVCVCFLETGSPASLAGLHSLGGCWLPPATMGPQWHGSQACVTSFVHVRWAFYQVSGLPRLRGSPFLADISLCRRCEPGSAGRLCWALLGSVSRHPPASNLTNFHGPLLLGAHACLLPGCPLGPSPHGLIFKASGLGYLLSLKTLASFWCSDLGLWIAIPSHTEALGKYLSNLCFVDEKGMNQNSVQCLMECFKDHHLL